MFALIALLSCGIGVYFRLYPILGKNEQKARNIAQKKVYTYLKNKIAVEFEAKSGYLSKLQKTRLVNQNFRKMLRSNHSQIESMITEGKQQLLGYDPDWAGSFLLDGDSYFYYSQTESLWHTKNVKETGVIFDSLHPYTGFYLHKIISFFTPEASVFHSIQYPGIILSVLATLLFIIACYLLEISPVVTFTASIFFCLSAFFTQKTTFACYDTDVYNVLFPAAISLFIYIFLKNLRQKSIVIVSAVCASFLTVAYKIFWSGGGYFFLIIILSAPFFLLLDRKLNNSGHTKAIFTFLAVYFLLPLIGASLLGHRINPVNMLIEGGSKLAQYHYSTNGVWPNMLLTVAETQPSTIAGSAFLLLGNKLLFYLACLGCIIYFLRSLRSKNLFLSFCSLSVFLWIACISFVSFRSLRFLVLLTFPISISFTMFLQCLFIFLQQRINGGLKIRSAKAGFFKKAIPAVILISGIILPLNTADRYFLNIHPFFNRPWDAVLLKIKQMTPGDSIINSWWSPGYLVSAVAKRNVVLNGGTQGSSRNYWMARVFLSDDEKTAIGLLRMIDLSGEGVIYILRDTCGMTLSEAIDFTKQLVVLDRQSARKILVSRELKEKDIDLILNMLYQNPKPAYFLVYDDLLNEFFTLSYIANWSFSAINNNKSMDTRGFGNNITGMVKCMIKSDSGSVSCSPEIKEVSRVGDIIGFENNFYFNVRTKESFLLDPLNNNYARIQSLFFIENGELREIICGQDNTIPFSVLVIEKAGSYYCIFFDRAFIKTLLFKLLYLDGKDLIYFTPWITETDPISRKTVRVYKINWGPQNKSEE